MQSVPLSGMHSPLYEDGHVAKHTHLLRTSTLPPMGRGTYEQSRKARSNSSAGKQHKYCTP